MIFFVKMIKMRSKYTEGMEFINRIGYMLLTRPNATEL